MRYVYRTSPSGSTGIGDRAIEETAGDERGYLFVSTSLGETLIIQPPYTDQSFLIGNRFSTSFSTAWDGSGNYFSDILETGINYIEYKAASTTAVPPIPVTTLSQIERKTSQQQVTIQQLRLDFTVQSSVVVNVYQPDINAAETSNYGTVLAASYG
jgi:hypothetical protein